MINLLENKSYKELPPADYIKGAVQSLLSTRFVLLVKMNPKLVPSGERRHMYLISFADHVYADDDWDRHPDGIGYLHRWAPSNGRCIVVAATGNVVVAKVGQYNGEIIQKDGELRTRLSLGEIDKSTMKADLEATVSRVFDDAVIWATSL